MRECIPDKYILYWETDLNPVTQKKSEKYNWIPVNKGQKYIVSPTHVVVIDANDVVLHNIECEYIDIFTDIFDCIHARQDNQVVYDLMVHEKIASHRDDDDGR